MVNGGATNGQPGATVWGGYTPVSIVALLGLLITLYFFRQVTDWERQSVYTAFREASQDRILVIQRELKHTLATIEDIASYFEASPVVGRREFRKFVEPAIKLHVGIKALMWIPQVSHEEREQFVLKARESFPPFEISELGPVGEIEIAGDREVYLPALYVQPYQSNKKLLGMDMKMDPTINSLLSRSVQVGGLQISERVVLVDDDEVHNGIAVSVPVYYRNDVEFEGEQQGAAEIRGFAAGIFRVGDIVELALEALSVGGIDIRLYDETDDAGEILLYTHASRMSGDRGAGQIATATAGGLVHHQSLQVGGRYWGVVCTPIEGRFVADAWSGWIVLLGGISFTALLTVYVASLVGRTRKINRLVALRTAELSGAIATMNSEIKERKAAELELKTLNDDLEYWVAIRSSEAERRAQDLEQFAYVTSHDLKAPLRAISNLAEWIGEDLEEKLNDESREQLALLQDRVRRMNALIEGLLEYSRVGRSERSYTEVDTRELLKELIDSLAPIKGFNIKIRKGMPVFRADRLLLGQVFSNLISNSLKHHGGEQGRIKIGCEEAGAFYEFSVSDDGMGIAPEYHDKVFMIFQTLRATDYGSNTGIGLALVKRIVEEQGGRISLESEPGKGALFRFTWPR